MINFREGDIVTLEAKLDYIHPDDKQIRLSVIGSLGPTYVARNNVNLAKPVIEVGDTVRLKKGRISNNPVGPPSPVEDVDGFVLSVAADHAWVEIAAGVFGTWWLPNVERIAIAGQEPEVWEEGGRPKR